MAQKVIQHSSQSIRCYWEDNTLPNRVNLSEITNWCMSLDGKNIELRSITGIEVDSLGKWQITHEDAIEIFQIQNPNIVGKSLSFERFSKMICIKTVALDFDPIENQLVVHLPATQITENPHTQPKTVLRQNPVKYIFTLK